MEAHRGCSVLLQGNNDTYIHICRAPRRALRPRYVMRIFFSLIKRFLRPAFPDYAHFSFLTCFVCFFFSARRGVHQHHTPKLHYPCFISDILVASYVLSCVPSACPSVSALAPEPLEQIVHRARTAFLYLRGRRLEAWFTRRRIGSRRQFALGQSADAGLPSLHDTLEKLGC